MSFYNPQFNAEPSDAQGAHSRKQSHLYIVKDYGEESDWKDEVAHWFAPINFYVYLWQPVRLRNYFLTRHPFFKKAFSLPHFNTLWDNICKGSFAYNTFLYRKPAFSKNYKNTFVADLTCLALLFGDEFIDGICNEVGKPVVQDLLKENGNKFYLNINRASAGYPELEYCFDLYNLVSENVWSIRNEKYGISYAEFYELLKDLLELINYRLGKMKLSIAENAAEKIKDACDLCFDTFIHDVKDIPVQLYYKGIIPPTAWHEKKNRSIQLKLLELRCVLFGKDAWCFEKHFNGWLDIISTMQVYDDMQDCRDDDHFQDNLLLAFASGNFPDEMNWFHENKKKLFNDEEWRMQVSLHMPCSSYLCTKFTKDRMVQNMSWVQKKICNYLWKNNWFKPGADFEKRTEKENAKRFAEVIDKTSSLKKLTGSETEWLSFAFEISFHDKQLRKYLLSNSSWMNRYFLFFNFLQMSSYEKMEVVKKIIQHQSAAVA